MGYKFNSERFQITCCKDCPDRHPGCHGSCEKYKAQRAEYDAKKAECMEKYNIAAGLYEQRTNAVFKAYAKRRYYEKCK